MEAKNERLWGGWCSNAVGSYGVQVWKNMRGWGDCSRFVRFEIGDWSRISFWHEMWVADRTLKEAFPVFFSFAHFKEASIPNHLQFSNHTCQWNIIFIKVMHDWEIELVTSFFDL